MYEQIAELIIQNKLTADQIIYLMSLHKNDGLLSAYPKPFFRQDIQELIDKGYVVGSATTPLSNTITPEGFDLFFVDEDDSAREIWDLYPDFFDKYQTKSMDKELFILLYMKKTDNNKKKHEKIKQLLTLAIESGWINRKIENWIKSEQWEEWEKMIKQQKPIEDGEFK